MYFIKTNNMKLLNKIELLEALDKENLTVGTNRILEFPFRIEIEGTLNNVFTDVMIVINLELQIESIEFDVVEDFYTVDQKDGIENLLNRELC